MKTNEIPFVPAELARAEQLSNEGKYSQAAAVVKAVFARPDRNVKLSSDGEAFGHILLGVCCVVASETAQALMHFNLAHQLAVATANLSLQSRALSSRAKLYGIVGNYEGMIADAEQALSSARIANDRIMEARAIEGLGYASRLLGELTRALEYYKLGLELGVEKHYVRGVLHQGRGYVSMRLGDYPQALEHLWNALLLAEEMGWKPLQQGCIAGLGSVYHAIGDYTRAVEYKTHALALIEELGDRAESVILRTNLGNTYCLMGDYSHALLHYRQALEESHQIVTPRSVGYLLHGIAVAESRLGNIDVAERGLLAALQHRRTVLKSNDGVNETLVELGKVLLAQGKIEEGISLLKEGLSLSDQVGDRDSASYAHGALADAFAKTGSVSEEVAHLRSYHMLREAIMGVNTRRQIDTFNIRVAIADKERDAKLARLEKEQAEAALRLKERDLANTASSLAAQTELLGNFRADLRKIVLRPDRYEPEDILRQVKAKLKELPREMIDFSKFEGQFATVHPEFRAKLETKYPELTPQEVKMCMLIHVNLQTAAIARLMCISERTVEDHRANVRKKMSLQRSDDLAKHLRGIDAK